MPTFDFSQYRVGAADTAASAPQAAASAVSAPILAASAPSFAASAAIPAPVANAAATQAARLAQAQEQQSSPIQAFLRSTGQAATAGLAQYPAALGIQITRGLTGGAPLSYAEALEEVKSQNRQLQQQNPTAYTLGQIVGTVPTITTGGGLASGRLGQLAGRYGAGPASTAIPAVAARGAIYGGAQGFSENESLSEAARSAAVGAALTGSLATAGRAVGKGVKAGTEYMAAKDIVQASKDGRLAPESVRAMKESIYGVNASEKILNSPLTPKEVKQIYKIIGEDIAASRNLGEQAKSMLFREPMQAGVQQAMSSVAPSALGAVGVAGLGGLAGVQDPLALALLAGAGSLGAAKMGFMQGAAQRAGVNLGELSMANPQMLPQSGVAIGEALGRAGTAIAGPSLATPYTAPPQTRLQQLADDFRQQYGGR